MIAKRYILEEVAAELRVKKRWLTDFLRAHPRDEYGEPFFRLAGRVKLFTESDISRIYKALPCPSSSSRPAKAKVRTSRSAGRTSASQWTRAAALTGDPSLAPSFAKLERAIERGEYPPRQAAAGNRRDVLERSGRLHGGRSSVLVMWRG